jgi:hypothetical protein
VAGQHFGYSPSILYPKRSAKPLFQVDWCGLGGLCNTGLSNGCWVLWRWFRGW